MSEQTPDDDALLRAHLARTDEECPSCGYPLRGLQEPACPECGERLGLRVIAPEPRTGVFLGGLLGLAFGAGWFLVSAALFPVRVVMSPYDWAAVLRWDLPYIAGACACGAPLALWIGHRRRLRGASRGALALATICCWAWPALCVAGAELLVRP